MASKCAKCDKTVYSTEEIKAAGSTWHKLCFQCCDPKCGITLKLNTYKGHEGKVYCDKHVPKPTATAVMDSKTEAALNAPKKGAEGLGNVQKGTGEKPNVGADSMSVHHATSAPSKESGTTGKFQKGTGEKPNVGADSMSVQHATNAPKKFDDSSVKFQKGGSAASLNAEDMAAANEAAPAEDE